MIVPPALQDLPETMTPGSSTSSDTRDNGGDHHSSPTITSKLSNLQKVPKDLPAGFRFRAALHHEVADSAPTISGYKKLEDMVRAYHIPLTILLRTGAPNERACTVSQTGWIPVYVDHFDAGLRFPLPGLVFDLLADYELALTQLMPNSIRSLFQCRLCPNSRGAKWYYLSGREKSQLFKNIRNKVARWKRQFIFVHDTRTERINNDLAGRLSEWRVPNAHVNYPQLLPRDTDIKNWLLEYARGENLINLDALVTSEQLAVFGFVDVANLFIEGILNSSRAESYVFVCAGEMSSILERQRQRAQGSRGCGVGSTSHRQTRFDKRPPPAPLSRSSSHRGSSSASRPRADQRADTAAPSARRRAREETDSKDDVPLHDAEQVVGLSRHKRLNWRQRAHQTRLLPRHEQQQSLHLPRPQWHAQLRATGGSATGKELRATAWRAGRHDQANGRVQLREKASLVDDVNRLQGSEMANRAAAAESRAEELANKIDELREELKRARAEREGGIQAAKEEAARVEERAKRAEAERDRAQNELGSLRFQVAEADKNLSVTEEALNKLKASHARSVGIARAQGAEWLVGSSTFQDAVAVASANMTTEIYNEIHGKVLHHRPDFPIRELAFFDGEDIDEQGKSLAPPADTTVRLRWDLNEEGVPVWPPSEPSSTPPNSQPAVVPARSLVITQALEVAARSPPARSSSLVADASMPVDLTDD
ncbi:hypothetical protein SLEP1_g29447 [Rubroshorea leprosula]|uniref:Uncharacterized protein n=1 Tax=Rubroshorea leprosula TaxID=152421 RepID=A0AAV5K5Y7_9ROSI|nr:hypothetical protein SLEP1_g29447 [Rubroshorea leprosula]